MPDQPQVAGQRAVPAGAGRSVGSQRFEKVGGVAGGAEGGGRLGGRGRDGWRVRAGAQQVELAAGVCVTPEVGQHRGKEGLAFGRVGVLR